MSLVVRQICGTFVAEIDAVNLADDHGDPEIVDIRDALLEHGVLVFHGQDLSSEEGVELSKLGDKYRCECNKYSEMRTPKNILHLQL